jgi:NAD(P)-dependent dehydrogenase (short-subunit alcohol dehydrogenase family)
VEVQGSVALVTGANRGLGRAFVDALLAAGAAKVYAAARNPQSISNPLVSAIRLDVTSADQVAAAAAQCADLTLLIDNAGIMLGSPMLAEDSEDAMRREMEVNVFGTLRMIRAFAPVLARNGGGTIVNVLSVVSWFTAPFNATYGASKHAELAVTDASRIQLKAQGTHVLGVYAGYIDTDMAADVDAEKSTPREVVERSLEGVESGIDHVLADARAHAMWQARCTAPRELEQMMQAAWDAGASSA